MCVDRPYNKVVAIGTDKYAGNFEREMCAYITAQYGECGVGDDIAKEVEGDIVNIEWFEDYVVREPDDHGCYRPCSMWQNKNSNYNDVAIFVEEFPTGDVLDEIEKRAKAFCVKRNLVYLGIRFFEPKYEITEVEVKRK